MRDLDKASLALNEDWYGDTAAVTCYACHKVFLVSRILHRKGRACPVCGRPIAGVICLVLQLTLLGWIPATIWAVYAVSQYKTDQKIHRFVTRTS